MSIARAMLQIVRFVRSATPFCGGESGTVFSYVMPCDWQYDRICPWMSSGALSTRSNLIRLLVNVSAAFLNSMKRESASLLFFMRKRDMNLE